MSLGVVVVTGCDSGFGKDAALKFENLGFTVVAGCLTEDGKKALAERKGNIIPATLDVTKDDVVKTFADEVAKVCKDKPLKAVVNNAGMAPTGFVEWAPIENLQLAMNINVFGQIRLVKALLPLLRQAKGRVVNVSSICGLLSFGGAGWYGCTKFAVEGWTDALRREMSPFGVSVHLVEPGFFKTNMVNVEQYATILKKQWADLPEEAKKAYGEQTLTGYIQNVKDQVDMLADPDTSKVINAMVTAATAKYPKTRYAVGGSARFLFVPISYLPTWLADGVLAGMNQKYKPDASCKPMIVRHDIAALWLLGIPAAAYTYFNYSSSAAAAIMTAALCLTSKWS